MVAFAAVGLSDRHYNIKIRIRDAVRNLSWSIGKYSDKLERRLTTKRQENAKEQHEFHYFFLDEIRVKVYKEFGGNGVERAEGCDCTTYRARELMQSTDMQPLYIYTVPSRQQPIRDMSQYEPMN